MEGGKEGPGSTMTILAWQAVRLFSGKAAAKTTKSDGPASVPRRRFRQLVFDRSGNGRGGEKRELGGGDRASSRVYVDIGESYGIYFFLFGYICALPTHFGRGLVRPGGTNKTNLLGRTDGRTEGEGGREITTHCVPSNL